MRFQKFVQKYTRPLFLFLVILMALSLVMWGYGGAVREEEPGDAGIIFDTIHVSKGRYRFHEAKAVPAYWWKQYNDPNVAMMMRYGRPPENPSPEQLVQQAWENIVLLQDAAVRGIKATDYEVALKKRDLYRAFIGDQPFDDPEVRLDLVVETYLHTGPGVFNAWAADLAVIDKLLGLVEEGSFADYAMVYDAVLQENRRAKVWAAAFDPGEYRRDLKPMRPEEIAQFYETGKDRFKMPTKIQVAYIMLALDDFKAGVPAPSEEEVRKYYEERKTVEFRDPESKREPPESRPLDAVRGEIADRITAERARLKALKAAGRIDIDIGNATKNGSYPEDLFDRLQEKFSKEGVLIKHDVTPSFDAARVEELEKAVGRNSGIASWGFDSDLKVGNISSRVETDKGFVFFRLQKRIDMYDPGLTEPVRERIVRELEKRQLQRIAFEAAQAAKDDAAAHGIGAARRGTAAWKPGRYFEINTGDPGFDEPGLADAVRRMFGRGQLTLEKRATIIPGVLVHREGEKKDWTYVAYLEDEVDAPPGDVDAAFDRMRSRIEPHVRREAGKKYVDIMMKQANVQDLVNKKEEGKKPDPTKAP